MTGHIQPLGRPAPGLGGPGDSSSEVSGLVPGGGYDEGGFQVGLGPSGAPSGWVSSETEPAPYSSFTPSLFPVAPNRTPEGTRNQGNGTVRRLCTPIPAGAGVLTEVVGARRSTLAASAGAAPSARTPITAAPAAPPPSATSVTRRGRGSGADERKTSPGGTPWASDEMREPLSDEGAVAVSKDRPASRVFTQPSRSTRSRHWWQSCTCDQARSSSAGVIWPSSSALTRSPRWPPIMCGPGRVGAAPSSGPSSGPAPWPARGGRGPAATGPARGGSVTGRCQAWHPGS